MAGQVKKESHNSHNPYLMININRNRSDLAGAKPGSVLRTISSELIKRFMKA